MGDFSRAEEGLLFAYSQSLVSSLTVFPHISKTARPRLPSVAPERGLLLALSCLFFHSVSLAPYPPQKQNFRSDVLTPTPSIFYSPLIHFVVIYSSPSTTYQKLSTCTWQCGKMSLEHPGERPTPHRIQNVLYPERGCASVSCSSHLGSCEGHVESSN